MDKLHTTMVNTCDRLLAIVTGPHSAADPVAAEAALEAIEFLLALESRLKGCDGRLPIDLSVPNGFRHPAVVSRHVTDVFRALDEEGRGCPAGSGQLTIQ